MWGCMFSDLCRGLLTLLTCTNSDCRASSSLLGFRVRVEGEKNAELSLASCLAVSMTRFSVV